MRIRHARLPQAQGLPIILLLLLGQRVLRSPLHRIPKEAGLTRKPQVSLGLI